MSFLKKLLGLGVVAGAAYGAYAYMQNVRAQKEANDDSGVVSTIGDLTHEAATYAIVPGDDEDEGETNASAFAEYTPNTLDIDEAEEAQMEDLDGAQTSATVTPTPILGYSEVPYTNPIEAAPAVRLGSGYIDPTTIAKAEDFQNWDELGCRS